MTKPKKKKRVSVWFIEVRTTGAGADNPKNYRAKEYVRR